MEIENDRPDPDPDYAVADLVDGLNDMLGAGTYDYIATGAIGTDAIKVAMIYQPGKVTPVGDYAILDSTVDARFLDDYNRPVLAQSFEDNIIGETITVAVNHLKSKGSDCEDVSDPDVGDGQGNCNLTRLDAAQAEVDWLATDPTGSSSDYFMIIGDLNAYDKEDPIDAVKAGSDDTLGTDDDYLDLIYEFLGEDAYSYLFDGRIGYLDYAMANMALAEFVADVAVWHINADEPDILDYDMSFKKPPQDAIFAPDAFRASDHDPVIVTLTFNQGPGAINDYYVTNQDVPLDVPVPGVLENDFDLNQYDEISIEVLIWPKYGELTLGLNGDGEWDGSFSYVPYPGFFGQDGFAYRMYAFPPDRAEFSDEALVIIDVKPAHQYFMPFIKNP